MKYLLTTISLAVIAIMSFIIILQADNNKQLIYDLNVSQTVFLIQSDQIAKGLCLPRLESR